MFGSVGWGEILVLLLVALFVFGPDRLPSIVKDAGGMLRKARGTLTGARRQLRDEFGDDLPNIDPQMLNPKQFVRRHLLEDIDDAGEFDEPPFGRGSNSRGAARNGSADSSKPVSSSGSGSASTPAASATQSATQSAPSASSAQSARPTPSMQSASATSGGAVEAAGSAGSTGSQSASATALSGGSGSAQSPAAPYDPDTT